MEASTGSGWIDCTLHLENLWLLWTAGFFLTPTFTDSGLSVLWVYTNSNNDCRSDHIRKMCVDYNTTLYVATSLEITVLFSTNFCWICSWSVLNLIGDINARYSALALVSFLNLASSEPRRSAVGPWRSCCVPISPQAHTTPAVNAALGCAVLAQLWDPAGCWAREPRAARSPTFVSPS